MQWTTGDLVPNLIRGLRNRKRPFASVVCPDGGLEHISVEDIHHASNRAAWFLHRNLNIEDKRFYYMGPSDIRYLIWTIAAMKTRKCVVCPSPGNTIPSNLRLFATVGATKLLYAPESSSSLQPLLESLNETTGSMPTPSYSEFFNRQTVDEFPFPFTFDEIGDRPFMGLHTSGTSGHPKPIYWNHTAIATIVTLFDFDTLPHPPKRQHLLLDVLVGNNVFLPFPLYHVSQFSPFWDPHTG
jgi:acyl-coenzyme A synthetase/AMP-(fatty) acid ligase